MTASKKKADIWMPLYISDYLCDTMHLNTEQHGAYLLLLMASWKSSAQLPNIEEQLQSITRLSPARWKVVSPILRQFFYITDDFWIHERVRKELTKAKKNTEAKAEAGAKGAKTRWQKDGRAMAEA